MIMDRLNTFANAVALPTSGTGWFNVGDVIDLVNQRDIGRGKPPLYLAVLVNLAVTGGGGATVQFALASDSQNPPRADGSSENLHYESQAIAVATLIAGYELIVPVPMESPTFQRYLGFQVNVGTAALTAGFVTAVLVADPNAWKSFPAAVYS